MFKFIRQWWSGSKECFCCKRWFSPVVLLKGACLECRSKLAYFPEIKTVTIADVIEKFLNDAARISEQTLKILSLEKTLEERDLSSSQQKLDWYKARDGYVAIVARLSNEILQLQENIRGQSSAFEHERATLLQREATIRELEFKVKQFDEQVAALTEEWAATVAHLNDELTKAVVRSETLTQQFKADFTAAAATERKQKEELNRLRQILSVWDKAGEAIIRAYKIEHNLLDSGGKLQE